MASFHNAGPLGAASHEWTVHSVVVRVRDGPECVRAANGLSFDAASLSSDGAVLPVDELASSGCDQVLVLEEFHAPAAMVCIDGASHRPPCRRNRVPRTAVRV